MPKKPEPLTAADRVELQSLRELYDLGKPAAEKIVPVPHGRLLRLVELERRDAAGGAP